MSGSVVIATGPLAYVPAIVAMVVLAVGAWWREKRYADRRAVEQLPPFEVVLSIDVSKAVEQLREAGVAAREFHLGTLRAGEILRAWGEAWEEAFRKMGEVMERER